jgi:hypothetical protein
MPDKMRRYMITFYILLILSALHSALAAPVAGSNFEPNDNPGGYIEDYMLGSELSWESDAREPDPSDMKSDDEDDDNGNGGHDGDNYDPSDNDHSAYGSTGYMSQGLEPEHPASPEPITDVEKILGSLRPRPRNSGSAAAGTSKWELQGTVDTEAYVSDSFSPSSNNPSRKYFNLQFNG